jgi:uncharacterized protein (DUF1015 family)
MEIAPFAGYRYNLDKIGSLGNVIAPPYDVIDETMQQTLFDRHPNNAVRLILDKMNPTDDAQDNRYTRTAKTLADWKAKDILQRDDKPAIYVYHQVYEADGKQYTRKGFMCRCKAVPFGYGMVFPHEITMSGPKADRLMLTTACKMNFSQIFGLYPDANNSVQNHLEEAVAKMNPPLFEAADDLGVVHRMWVLDDPAAIDAAVKEMEQKPIFIADGHHRYETACNYRKQIDDMGLLTSDHPANYVLMVCIAMDDPGLIVMPTHRLFTAGKPFPVLTSEELKAKLTPYFTVCEPKTASPDAASVWAEVQAEHRQDAIGLYTPKDGKWLITAITEEGKKRMSEAASEHHPEWQELGVSLLHHLIVENLLGCKEYPKPHYVHLVDEVAECLKAAGENAAEHYPLAALVQPATVEHIKTISMLGDRMPAKSTYFYPKLIVGFVFNPLE